MSAPAITLRPVTAADADHLLAWRNDPETRRQSFAGGPVAPQTHACWVTESLARTDRRLWIAEVHDGGAATPVGTVRLDRHDDGATVSITTAPEWRGRGVGTAMLDALSAQAFAAGVTRLVAEVKADNFASRAAFARAGYRVAEHGDVMRFERFVSLPTAPRARVVATIQARMGSTRLPGKVLRPLAGKPMIGWLALRLRACRELEDVIISTSVEPANDAVATYAAEIGMRCVRGSETDLIQRLLLSARETGADAIVRVTADCPFVDPDAIDTLVRAWRDDPALEYVFNNEPPTLPHGLEAEVIPTRTLERLDGEVADPYFREWIPLWVKGHRHRIRVGGVHHPVNLSGLRWTVDYPEDLEFAERVFSVLAGGDRVFGMDEALAFLRAHPDVVAINEHCGRAAVPSGGAPAR